MGVRGDDMSACRGPYFIPSIILSRALRFETSSKELVDVGLRDTNRWQHQTADSSHCLASTTEDRGNHRASFTHNNELAQHCDSYSQSMRLAANGMAAQLMCGGASPCVHEHESIRMECELTDGEPRLHCA